MQERSETFGSNGYRFSFNGQEQDSEVSGDGNSYTTHFRQYDSRLGRWFSRDPALIPWQTPYASMNNSPIVFNDQRVDISRAGLVFHALAEMYLRTEPLGDAQKPGYPNEYGMPYSLRDPSGYNGTSNGGAHEGAIELQGAKYGGNAGKADFWRVGEVNYEAKSSPEK